jgi:hypothetical protein
MRALELISIMLTCISWRTITVNLLTHRHAITRAWAVMYLFTFKFNVWHLNKWLSDRNIHKIFSMKTLMHTTTSSKTTHIIKTSLIKQWYTWHAWTGAINAVDTVMMLILVLLGYVCSILHALCSVFDQYIFHYCIML